MKKGKTVKVCPGGKSFNQGVDHGRGGTFSARAKQAQEAKCKACQTPQACRESDGWNEHGLGSRQDVSRPAII